MVDNRIIHLTDHSIRLLGDVDIPEVDGLPRILALVWLDQSPDFQAQHDIFEPQGRNAFFRWWKSDGYRGYLFASQLLASSDRSDIGQGSERGGGNESNSAGWLHTSTGLRLYRELVGSCVDKNSETDIAGRLLEQLADWKSLVTSHLAHTWLDQVAELLLPCCWLGHGGYQCPNLALLVWLSRRELMTAFDLTQEVGREAFADWWQGNGPKEYLDVFQSLRSYLEAETPANASATSFPTVVITNGSLIFAKNFIAADAENDILKRLDASFVMWLLCNEQTYLDDVVRRFNVGSGAYCLKSNSENADELLREAVFAHRHDKDLNFVSSDSSDYRNWWINYGRDQYKVELERLVQLLTGWTSEGNRHRNIFCCRTETSTPRPLLYNDVDFENKNPQTINIIGIPDSSLGISEDFRQLACAVSSAGYNIQPIHQPSYPAGRSSDLCDAIPAYKGRVNIFVQPAFLTAGMISRFGIRQLERAINIACWQWEFPNVPRIFSSFPSVFDEMWAISSFVAKGFVEKFSLPVHVLPQVVDVSIERRFGRPDFGMEEDKKYFLVAFDGASTVARKNPFAAIRAFKLAFPSQEEGVNLIVKTYNLNSNNGLTRVLDEIAADPRIILINRAFSPDEMRSLIACSDYYVSLHRAEGFGRIIAEAMLLGKPVIVSNYSGNMDYCNDNNALLVEGGMIHPKAGEYLLCDFPERYQWFEASIDDAAEKMQRCYFHDAWNAQRIEAARKTIEARYNPGMLHEFVVERLARF